MKKNFKFILIAPFFLAILCESEDVVCAAVEPPAYNIQIENIEESYAVSERLWLNSEVSSMLLNGCSDDDGPELILDSSVFLDAIFLLKLNSSLTDLNAEVSEDFDVIYDIGEAFIGDYCSDAIEYLPELTDDNLNYEFRIGLAINSPGDYCIVNARNSFFDVGEQNNAQIFEPYNNLDNTIKFTNCSNTYTRNGTDSFYFFSVE